MKGESYLFVVSGPSGVGKDSVMTCLRQAHPEIEKIREQIQNLE